MKKSLRPVMSSAVATLAVIAVAVCPSTMSRPPIVPKALRSAVRLSPRPEAATGAAPSPTISAIPYIHFNKATEDQSVTNNFCMINPSAFHSYVAEWSPTSFTIKYDGAICMVHNWNPAAPLLGSAPFDQPFIVALTQALGVGENAFDPATTPLPATTQVDYVRVWA